MDYMRAYESKVRIRFLSCMESLRFSLSLMPDMFAFAVFWKGVVWCSDEL